VVNDASTDKMFKYTLAGALVGSWTISAGGGSPTGITLDPSNVSHLWVVDSGTDRVYQYDNAVSRTSGSQAASTSFALAPGNTNPQGIADPPAPTSSWETLPPSGPTGRLPHRGSNRPGPAWNDALAWGGNLNSAAWDAPPLGTLRGDWWLGRAEEEGHGPGDGPPNRGGTEESPTAGTGHSLVVDAATEDAALRDLVFAGDPFLSGLGLLWESDLVEALLLPEREGSRGTARPF
jgi:hypothetical protein